MGIVDLIFPKSCLGCGRHGKYICSDCIRKVKTPRPVCPFCMRPSINGKVHSFCHEPLGLDGLISLWQYEGVARKAIINLKYKFALEIAKEISDYAVPEIEKRQTFPPKNVVLVPIPLYWYKRNFRGFNQVEEIGRLISIKLNWEFIPNLLIKSTSTTSQTELKRQDRIKNLKGVFTPNFVDFPKKYSRKIIAVSSEVVWK